LVRETAVVQGDGKALSERAREAARQLGLSSSGADLFSVASMFPRFGGSHFLVMKGQDPLHIWVPEGDDFVWSQPAHGPLGRLVSDQLRCLQERLSIEGIGGHRLVYQPMGPLPSSVVDVQEGAGVIGLVLEEGNRVIIRKENENSRTVLEYLIRPETDLRPTFILSRLSSKGLRSVPELLGTSYWSRGEEQRPWMRMVRFPRGTGPAMSPFLSDLSDLTLRFLGLEGDKAKQYMMGLASSEQSPSFSAAFRLGLSLGELHGKVLFTPEEASSVRGDRNRSDLAGLFMNGKMGMEQVGALVGCYSSCQASVRKGLTKILGDPEPASPSGQRKLKVVRKKGRAVRGEGLEQLSMLRWHFLREAERLRSLVMGLKALSGTPAVMSGLDARLDRMEMTGDGQFIFKRFDFALQRAQGRTDDRMTGLKDLSLVLNSFMKVRYLCASSLLRKASLSLSVPAQELETVFLDYNMAKRGHRAMLTDLPVWLRIGHKEAGFRYTFAAAVVGSIWYEKARNQLVSGYNMGVGLTGRDELLEYPEKVDTVECMRSIQCLAALSSASDALSHPEGPRSSVGLSNDLFTALLV
jgi:hypothetical protein